MLDELLDVGKIDGARDDENAVGAGVGDELGFADDEVGFELPPSRSADRGLDHLTLGIDLRCATGVRRTRLARRAAAFLALLEEGLQEFDDFFGIGAFQLDELGHDLRRWHIDHGLQRDELLDDGDVFGDENRLHIGHRGEGGVGLGRTDKSLEKLRGLLRGEVVELHEVAHDLIRGRQQVGRREDRNAFGPRELRGAQDFRCLLVDRDKRIAVEQERSLDQPDRFAARHFAGYHDGQRLPLREHRVPHETFIGQRFVKTEDFIDRSVGESEPDGWFGLSRSLRRHGRWSNRLHGHGCAGQRCCSRIDRRSGWRGRCGGHNRRRIGSGRNHRRGGSVLGPERIGENADQRGNQKGSRQRREMQRGHHRN